MVKIRYLEDGTRILIAEEINIWSLTLGDKDDKHGPDTVLPKLKAITLTDEMVKVIKQQG